MPPCAAFGANHTVPEVGDFCLRRIAPDLDDGLVPARVIQAIGHERAHALPAHVRQIHGRAGFVLALGHGLFVRNGRRPAQGATKSDRLVAASVIGLTAGYTLKHTRMHPQSPTGAPWCARRAEVVRWGSRHRKEARQQLRPANNEDRNKDRPVCVP